MRSFLRAGLLFGLVAAVGGCGSPPEAELAAAQASLDAAKQAEADVYAADAYNRARTTLADARSKSEAGEYEPAKQSAIQAKEEADQSRSAAEREKARLRDEAQAVVNRVSSGIGEARTALEAAPAGKGADEDLDVLRQDLGAAEASLGQAQASLGSGKLKDALAQAQAADAKLAQVRGAVETATKKIEDWKTMHRPWYEL